MSKHRAPERRTPPPVNRHRAPVRPRYGRIATLGGSVLVVLVALLGGLGAIPSTADHEAGDRAVDPAATVVSGSTDDAAPSEAESQVTPEPDATQESTPARERNQQGQQDRRKQQEPLEPIDPQEDSAVDEALPAESGTGYRVVFSEGRQRVWLVADDGRVQRTYLVSGSIYENLEPGTYEVYSRSEDAVGIDDSGTMEWFVRFTQGPSGAAIGFHSIPEKDGVPLQTKAQLGTPLSHGCIRQETDDALALWDFAPIGTTVVVTA